MYTRRANRYGFPKEDHEIFCENSTYARHNLKRKIIQRKLIEYKCACCDLIDSWNNKKLSLQIDHINGVNNDNRLENLRFLCPNCHSQTETYSGKNYGKYV
jgi:Zn finger protein HypA/HybF involved in hydrogenase expression